MSGEGSSAHDLPIREIRDQYYWHQGPARHDVDYMPVSPTYGGRFHVAGGHGVWYASSTQEGAWAEFFRHFLDSGVDPFEVRRRVGRVRVDSMKVLDLTEVVGRQTIGITLDDLTGDDYEQCRRVAALARDHGLDGILSPSAALPGSLTLGVFAPSVEKITVELSVVNTPPARLADLLASIRLHRDVPDAVRSLLRFIETLGSQAMRRRR